MKIEPLGKHGKRPTYQAKIGSFSSAEIIVKRQRDFNVNDRIEYADTKDLRGMSVSCTPQWKRGHIWKIEGDRLFISRGAIPTGGEPTPAPTTPDGRSSV